ncbi:MAG TPA: iron-sulfur cluster-binding domain-containing protein, partial [Casimicrobium sp.]|nr:iron-sulfur cluster-binding domain-containing protein [Casimicrobium sp.]
LLRRTLPHGNHEFYVCGPSAMMESVVPSIVAWGVPISDVHFEAFGPATLRLPQTPEMVVAKDERVEADIRFARTGRTITWDGSDASLLEFAERNGIPVESGCRSGSCGSCETKLVSGEVRYSHPPDFEVSPGSCLMCVAKPVSALVLEA